MANQNAGQLTLINGADVDQSNDRFYLWDANQSGAARSKAIIPSQVATAISAVPVGAVTSSGLTMATARLLGRTTGGTGAVEEITVGSGLSLSGGSLTATGGSSVLVAKKIVQDATTATGTNQIVFDNSIPQQTEGTEYGTQSYTPSASGNKLLIKVSGFCSSSVSAGNCTVALFKDSDANALSAEDYVIAGVAGRTKFSIAYLYTTVGTSSETWKMRFGPGAAITVGINQATSGAVFGGTSFVTWEFYEYTP